MRATPAALAPAAIALGLRAAGAGSTVVFLASAAALGALAWLIGRLTEQLAERTGAAGAALLNATLGNAPELIIALVAIAHGLPAVVQASLAGSVAANVLLVLGLALLVRRGGALATPPAPAALALIAVAAVALAVPAAGTAVGAPREGVSILAIAFAVAVGGAYLVELRRRLRSAAPVAPREGPLSARRSIGLLAVAIVLGVGVAETLVGSLEAFARQAGLGGFFVAAVVVAVAGNAVEHGAAVVLARRGRIDIAADIALSSSAQVAALLIPLAVLAATIAGTGPLTLDAPELAAVGVPAALVAIVLAGGFGRRRGLVLVGSYTTFALASLLAGVR
jgi:Ca2+:H+ antiporter